MTADIASIDLNGLRQMMAIHGVGELLVKTLAANDNSKNQPYLGGSLGILNILPIGDVIEHTTASGKIGLKAALPLSWLRADGSLAAAPHAQIILYPQYPEIRFSGFLKGTQGAPNDMMTVREAGRLLFFGVTADRKIIAAVAGARSRLAAEIINLGGLPRTGVFQHVGMGHLQTSRARLLAKLSIIHQKGWIDSGRLRADGSRGPCQATNCGGYTLEAELGITPNGRAEPDFDGWEIKAHAVKDFERAQSGNITLMTPEPTGGLYKANGAEAFVRRFGYSDMSGKPDRLNVSSPHYFGVRNNKTALTLSLIGYDRPKGRIIDPQGGFALVDDQGSEAAAWHYASLISHWNRKHAQAAYIPYRMQKSPILQYNYGSYIRLGEMTDFDLFLKAMADGRIFYDPGIKLEKAGETKPILKRRSQFRIGSAFVSSLYEKFETIDVQ